MMSNRLYRILGLIILSCQLSIINAFAQQAGDVISGTVVDDFGPVVMANVVEIDAANRIVASTVTDINGNFSFRVKNVKDKLRISFVGYKTQTFRFDRTHYEVTMVDATQISEVTVTARRRTDGAGLQIPLDEISTARQSIDMKIRVGEDPTLREFIDAYIDGVKRTMTELMMLMGEGVTLAECSRAYLSIIQQIAVLLPELSERQQQSITREQQVWHQVISRSVERGEVRSDIDTELMAQTFIALFYGRAYRDSLTTGLDADLLKRQMLQLYTAIALK